MKKIQVMSYLLIASIMFCSCGVRDNNDGGDGGSDLNLTPTEQLAADWTGLYRTVDDGKPSGEPQETTLRLLSNGTFILTLNGNEAARVEGEWSEFQGRSLILKISGSSIPRIGVAGKLIEPSYDLLGSSLKITNDKFELKLYKRPGGDDSNGGSNQPNPGIIGQWRCKSSADRTTSIVLSNNNTFRLTSLARNEQMFLASGSFQTEQSSVLILNPSKTSAPLAEGSFFQLVMSTTRGELSLMSTDGRNQKELGNCSRED